MTRLEILDFFNEIERKFPVNSWHVGEVQIWPFLRIQLAYKLIDHFGTLGKPIPNNKNLHISKNKLNARCYRNYKRLKILWHYYQSVKKVDFVFVGADSHRMNYKGEFVNKFFKPLIEEITDKGHSFYNLEYGLPKNYPENLPFRNKTSFIHELFPLFNTLAQKGIIKSNANDRSKVIT